MILQKLAGLVSAILFLTMAPQTPSFAASATSVKVGRGSPSVSVGLSATVVESLTIQVQEATLREAERSDLRSVTGSFSGLEGGREGLFVVEGSLKATVTGQQTGVRLVAYILEKGREEGRDGSLVYHWSHSGWVPLTSENAMTVLPNGIHRIPTKLAFRATGPEEAQKIAGSVGYTLEKL